MTLADLASQAQQALLLSRWDGFVTSQAGETGSLLRRLGEAFLKLAPDERERLSEEQQRLLAALRVAVAELERLKASGESDAVRHLGYAVHVVPEVLVAGQWSAREFLSFNFRVAAAHWNALSRECQQALCDLAGVHPGRAAELIARPGFACYHPVG